MPWSFDIRIVPIPHFSPCIPFPGATMSIAWLNRCSDPLQGLLLPAIPAATPELMRASTTTLIPSDEIEEIIPASSMIMLADKSAKLAEYLPKYSPVLNEDSSQSLTAVLFDTRSPQPLIRSF